MQHSIRQQLKLNEEEFKGAIDCSITRDGYVEILRKKGLIPPQQPPIPPAPAARSGKADRIAPA